MRTRMLLLTLSLAVLTLAGCKSTQHAGPQQALYTAPPPGAMAVPPGAPPAETAPPPLARPASHLPD